MSTERKVPVLDDNNLIPSDKLGTGSANNTKFLRGDQTWQTPAGGVSTSQTEIDFGLAAILEKSFMIIDINVSASSKIIGNIAYQAPTGKDLDELEMDAIDLKFAPGSGQFTIYAKGLEGSLHGKFKVNYLVN